MPSSYCLTCVWNSLYRAVQIKGLISDQVDPVLWTTLGFFLLVPPKVEAK